MFAHVVARTIGVVHRYSLKNALVLGNGVPKIAASLGRQALTFEKNTGKGMVHVDQKLVAGSSQNDLMEVETRLGIASEVRPAGGLAKGLDAFLQVLDFLFRMVDRSKLGRIARGDITKLVDLTQGIAGCEAPGGRCEGIVLRAHNKPAPARPCRDLPDRGKYRERFAERCAADIQVASEVTLRRQRLSGLDPSVADHRLKMSDCRSGHANGIVASSPRLILSHQGGHVCLVVIATRAGHTRFS